MFSTTCSRGMERLLLRAGLSIPLCRLGQLWVEPRGLGHVRPNVRPNRTQHYACVPANQSLLRRNNVFGTAGLSIGQKPCVGQHWVTCTLELNTLDGLHLLRLCREVGQERQVWAPQVRRAREQRSCASSARPQTPQLTQYVCRPLCVSKLLCS